MLILYGRPCFKWGSLSKNMCLTMPRNRKNSAMKIQNVGKSWYMIAGSPSEPLHSKILQKKKLILKTLMYSSHHFTFIELS